MASDSRPSSRLRIAIGALLCVSAVSASAAAADEGWENDPKMDEMVVLGVEPGMLDDDPSAFGTKIDLDTVLVGERKDLEQLLSEAVGVQIRRFGGPGERAEISIRGFSAAQVVVTLDGARLNSARSGSVDLSGIPIDLLETVEVSRGGGSVDVGSGGMGGVVRLRTRRPNVKKPSRVSVTGGSFGTWNASLYTGTPNDILDFGIGYDFFRTDGDFEFQRPRYVLPGEGDISFEDEDPTVERINNERERQTLGFNAGRGLGGQGYLLLHQTLGYSSQGEPGIPWCSGEPDACQQQHGHSRRFKSLSNLRWEEIDVGLPNLATEAAISYRFTRDHFKDPEPTIDPEGRDIDVRFDDTTLAFDLESIWQGEGLGAEHELTLQLGARRAAVETEDSGNEDTVDHNRFDADVMLRDRLDFFEERLSLCAALRFDWTEDFDPQWIPSLGAVYSPWPWLRFKSNIERSFRVPNFDELYLPDLGYISGYEGLDPEESVNFDVGLALALDRLGPFRDLRMEADYFRNAIDNRIIWIFVNPYRVEPRNTSEATTDGFEFLFAVGWTRFMSASVNYTYVDARYDSDGVPLPGVARDETNFRLQLADPGFWKVVGELQHTGEIPVSIGGGQEIPPRSVVNASAALNLATVANRFDHPTPLSNLWLVFTANNIADVTVLDSRFFPQPGRMLGLTVEGTW